MTQPRQILPGRYVMVTRRCANQHFFLRPSSTTTLTYEYCLAEAASRFGIELLAWSTMSNHHHIVLRDPKGELSDFMQRFHLMVAKHLNWHLDRKENFWSSQQACVTELVTEDDVIDKVVYTLCNPVTAHLVAQVSDWPGSNSSGRMAGEGVSVARPAGFFRDDGPMPTEAKLQTTPPNFKRFPTKEAWSEHIRTRVSAVEDRLARERFGTGKSVAGPAEILSASTSTRPTTSDTRRSLRPTVACKDVSKRVAALRALKEFRAEYRIAWRSFVGGCLDVLFPAGTWLMRRRGANCEPYPELALQ